MKKLLTLACVAMMATAASAQITWNVKAGAGVATCYGSDTENAKEHFVGKVGVGIEYPFTSNWSLMPSLEVAWKGTKINFGENVYYSGNYYDYDVTNTVDLFYVQVPIVAAYRLNLSDAWNMTFKAGPYFAYAVSDHYSSEINASDGSSARESGSAEVKKFDTGLDLGIDFEHHRFVFGVEYEMGLMKLVEDDVKNMAFYVTVGWKF